MLNHTVLYKVFDDSMEKSILDCSHKRIYNYGLLLTYDQEDEVIKNSKKITIMPVWKWMLQGKSFF